MIENTKTYNGHTYNGVLLQACLDGYQQGRADAIDDVIRAEKCKFHCEEDLCDGKRDCTDCRQAYWKKLKEQKNG